MKFYEMSLEERWPPPGSEELARIIRMHDEMVRGLLEQYLQRPVIGECPRNPEPPAYEPLFG